MPSLRYGKHRIRATLAEITKIYESYISESPKIPNIGSDNILFIYVYSMEKQNLVIFICIVAGIIPIIILFFIFKFYKRKINQIKRSELVFNNNEMSVPLLASFLGIKYVPSPFVLGHNNLNPKLTFLQDGIEYKFFFKKYKRYSDIESIDIWISPRTKNLHFKFNNSIFTFIGNLYDEKNLKSVLDFLKKKNCPLTSEAREFLEK